MIKKLVLLFIFTLSEFAFASENSYKVELISVSSKERASDFDFSVFFYDTNLFSTFFGIKNYVDNNTKNHFFSLSIDDIYINYSNNDDLLFSIGYWPRYQGIIIKKANDIMYKFIQDYSSKDDIDISIKLGQIINLENYMSPELLSKKMLVKHIDMNYSILLYYYNNTCVNVLLNKL